MVDAPGEQAADERYSNRFYLAAEIVSASDRTYVESKREIYKLHAHCKCVLTVQQDRCEVRVDRRTPPPYPPPQAGEGQGGGWEDQLLNKLDDVLVLPDFGLRCRLSDLYRGTAIQPR